MLDRALTLRIANAVSRGTGARGPAAPPPLPELPGDLNAICADAERRIVAYTGLRPAAPLPAPEAIARAEWIAANVTSMAAMLEPLGERLVGGSGSAEGGSRGLGLLRGSVRAATGAVLSAEAGALAGYLSQRVLGQYEFVLLDPESRARLLFVAPNIARAATKLDADLPELLAWIAFHEVTHAVQFAGVPWLRPYLAGLLTELLDSLEVRIEPRSLPSMPTAGDLKALFAGVRENGLVGVVGGAGRRGVLERVQGVMGVIEGHAEHVMDVVGAESLPSLEHLRAALDRRRNERPPLLALLERIIGLDAKLRQYENGKRFCDAVVAAAGPAALHTVFEAPEQLPTPAELKDPASWLRRTGADAVHDLHR